MMKRVVGAVLIALILFVPASFATEESVAPILSFDIFSQKVMEYYPQLKAANSAVEIALAQKMRAEAGFWPSLDISAGYRVSNDPVDVFGMLLRQERFTSADFDLKRLNNPDRHQGFSAGLHAEFPLFDAMQTIWRARAARENVRGSEADAAFTGMEALLIAEDAYLSAVTLETLSLIVDQAQKNSDDDLKKATDLKDRGMILGADYYSARVMFGNLTRTRNEIVRQRKAMLALLNILMGEPVDKTWTLSASLEEEILSSPDTAALMEAAFQDRPDLQALDAREKALDADVSRENATSLPRLSVFADAVNDRNKIASRGGSNYTVGLKVGMPLFDPAKKGRTKEARARRERMARDIQRAKDMIRRDIVEAVARHEALKDNLPVLKDMAADAGQALSLVLPLYNEGRKSIADVLEVRQAYLRCAEAYARALKEVWMSEARLLFLTGRLNTEAMNTLAREGSF